jgi:proline iminopeptidase
MKRKLLIGLLVVLLIVGVAGWLFVQSMGNPMYEPGMVREAQNLRGPLDPPKQLADESFWQVENDIRLFYQAHGTGRAVLVVHGGPGFPDDQPWQALEPLTSDYRFYYYHQRGCGRSTKPFDRFESKNFYANMTELERTLGIGAQVADMERIRRILAEKKLILIGHSFGGFLASMYSAEFSENVEALVLVAPAGVLQLPDPNGDLFAKVRERLPAAEREEYDRFLNEELFDFGNIFSKTEAELAAINRRSGGYLLKGLGEAPMSTPTAAEPNNGGWMPQALYLSMGRKHDYRAALSEVRAPVLILHGEEDDLLLSGSKVYEDSYPNAKLRIVRRDAASKSRAGHFIMNDQSGQFAQLVGEFLSKVRMGSESIEPAK